ncbi:transposase (fragment) [Mesorhizobium plurifarium]|uniref:Transposase n=1 Tax=Mesorhizobium plurifarium TaxID=69974 RepID=A0A090EIK1_MESPL
MNDPMPLSGLSSVAGKSVIARFDGGMLSSNSGVLALAEVEKRLQVAEHLARCIDDPRCPDQVVRILGYDRLAHRPVMRTAMMPTGCAPIRSPRWPRMHPSARALAWQSTMCRLENPSGVRELVTIGRAMVDLYCASVRQIPKRIVLDIETPSMPCTAAISFVCSTPINSMTSS